MLTIVLTILAIYFTIALLGGLFWTLAISSSGEGFVFGLLWLPILITHSYRVVKKRLTHD